MGRISTKKGGNNLRKEKGEDLERPYREGGKGSQQGKGPKDLKEE